MDIIELNRIEKIVKRRNKFVHRILTENERMVWDRFENEKRKLEFLAGRFAAKEAVAKAFGTGIGELSFQHIEVLSNKKGAPNVSVKGKESFRIFLSITHSREFAAAQAVVEKKED